MGYKLKSGQTIVDADGNLNVIQGATLHIAGDLYTNNQTSFAVDDRANGAVTISQMFTDSNPLHVGKNYGYFAGGDVIGHSRVAYGSDDVTFPTNGYYDFLFPRFVDPTAPSRSPTNKTIFVDIMKATHSSVSRFPFAISSVNAVQDHAELSYSSGQSNDNVLLGTALSDGGHGYYVGGFNVRGAPVPAPTSSTYVVLDQVSRYPFVTGGGVSSDVGELSETTYQATGHSSKNGSGYIIFSRNGTLAPPSTRDFHVQKFSFGSSTTSSYVGFFDLSLDPPIPSPTPAAPGAQPDADDRLHGFAGWTNSEYAFIAGGQQSSSTYASGFDDSIKRFNMASETFSLSVGTVSYDTYGPFGGMTGAAPRFHTSYRKAGASISSVSDGYWIGSGSDTFVHAQHTAIRRFPFANMVGREETVEGYHDSQGPIQLLPTYDSHAQHGLQFIGSENFPSVEPTGDFPNPGWQQRGKAPFFLAATGHASEDYGFVSHLEGPATSDMIAGNFFSGNLSFGMRSYTLKFPYANATHVIEVSESVPFTSTPVVLYPHAVQYTTENVLVAKGMMGQEGTVS